MNRCAHHGVYRIVSGYKQCVTGKKAGMGSKLILSMTQKHAFLEQAESQYNVYSAEHCLKQSNDAFLFMI